MVERKSILRSIDTINFLILIASLLMMVLYICSTFTDADAEFCHSAVLWMKILNRALLMSTVLQIVFCFIVWASEGKFFFRYLIGALVKLVFCFLPVIITTFAEWIGSGFSIAF